MRTKLVTKKCESCPRVMVDVDVNRKFCNHCSAVKNTERQRKRRNNAAEWLTRKSKWKFKCPMCGLVKSPKKYCRCHDCQNLVLQNEIVDTVAMECIDYSDQAAEQEFRKIGL